MNLCWMQATLSRWWGERQGLKIACLEEIAFRLGLIGVSQLEKAALTMKKNEYGKYLLDLVRQQGG